MKEKNFFCFIILVMLCFNSYGQEKWDEENCIYTNHTLNFHWALPVKFEWQKIMPTEKSTVFKAFSPYGISVHVTYKHFPNNNVAVSYDMWGNFNKFEEDQLSAYKEVKKRTGRNIQLIKIEKCKFSGEKSIRTIVRKDYEDDVINEHEYMITYCFYKKNSMWWITLSCPAEIYKEFDEYNLKSVFAGFGMNGGTQQ